jgi:hypothetical protein
VEDRRIQTVVEQPDLAVRDAVVGLQVRAHGFAIRDHGIREAVRQEHQRMIFGGDQIPVAALAGQNHWDSAEPRGRHGEGVEARIERVHDLDSMRFQVAPQQTGALPGAGTVQRADRKLQNGDARRGEFRGPHAGGQHRSDVHLEALWIQAFGNLRHLAFRASGPQRVDQKQDGIAVRNGRNGGQT